MLADSAEPEPQPPAAIGPCRDAIAPVSRLRSSVGDSNRKQHSQDVSSYEAERPIAYPGAVAKRGETGGRKKLPQAALDEVAKTVNALFEETGFTVRQASEAWKIDVASLNHARHATGSVGVGFLIKLRDVTGRPIDDLLKLPPLPKPAAKPPPPEHVVAIREAIEEARRFRTPEAVIEHVQRNFAMTHRDPARRKEAMLRAILRTWVIWAVRRVPELTSDANEWLNLHPDPEPERREEELEAVG